MFERKVITEEGWNAYGSAVLCYEAPEGAHLLLSGQPIPHSCIVIYASFDPANCDIAAAKFKKKLADVELQALQDRNYDPYVRLPDMLMTALQQSRSRKTLTDIDIDIIGACPTGRIRDIIRETGIVMTAVHPICTHSGMHLLIENDKAGYSKETNPETVVAALRIGLGTIAKEVTVNRNGMVPLPGTMQGGFPVRMLQGEQWDDQRS